MFRHLKNDYINRNAIEWFHSVPVVSNGSIITGHDGIVAHGATTIFGKSDADPMFSIAGSFKLSLKLEDNSGIGFFPSDNHLAVLKRTKMSANNYQ